ncbi:MAG: hypothetical protein WC796_04000 [Candidatus Pacearchaeota archaeon]|jgi:hypothetical protein
MKASQENLLALICLATFSLIFSNVSGYLISRCEISQAEQSWGRNHAEIVAEEIDKSITTPKQVLFFYGSKHAAESYLNNKD